MMHLQSLRFMKGTNRTIAPNRTAFDPDSFNSDPAVS